MASKTKKTRQLVEAIKEIIVRAHLAGKCDAEGRSLPAAPAPRRLAPQFVLVNVSKGLFLGAMHPDTSSHDVYGLTDAEYRLLRDEATRRQQPVPPKIDMMTDNWARRWICERHHWRPRELYALQDVTIRFYREEAAPSDGHPVRYIARAEDQQEWDITPADAACRLLKTLLAENKHPAGETKL